MPKIIPSVKRAFDILDLFFGGIQSLSKPEIAARLGLPRTTVHEQVQTLLACGYLEQDGTVPNRFTLGFRVFELGSVFASLLDPSQECLRAAREVSKLCDETVQMAIRDGRDVVFIIRAARGSKVTTQMGIQGHSGEGCRLIREWIAAGLIGEVNEVDAWCDLSYYPWGHAPWSSKWGVRPTDTPSLPQGMDWDLWIGPAPMRPYHPAYHPLVWRCWWDFGVGMMGDRGVHTFDPIYYALDLGAPESIEATSCGLNTETHPLANIVTYHFAARGRKPPFKLTWYDGVRAPRPEELEEGRNMPAEGGSIFKGTKGKIMAGIYGEDPRIIPEKLMQEVRRPKKTIPRVQGSHEQEWARACKAGIKAGASFEYSGPLTEICLLGNVAKRLDGKIIWDAKNMKVTNNPAAEPIVRRPYREGWSL